MVATWYLRRIASNQSACFSGLREYCTILSCWPPNGPGSHYVIIVREVCSFRRRANCDLFDLCSQLPMKPRWQLPEVDTKSIQQIRSYVHPQKREVNRNHVNFMMKQKDIGRQKEVIC